MKEKTSKMTRNRPLEQCLKKSFEENDISECKKKKKKNFMLITLIQDTKKFPLPMKFLTMPK